MPRIGETVGGRGRAGGGGVLGRALCQDGRHGHCPLLWLVVWLTAGFRLTFHPFQSFFHSSPLLPVPTAARHLLLSQLGAQVPAEGSVGTFS